MLIDVRKWPGRGARKRAGAKGRETGRELVSLVFYL